MVVDENQTIVATNSAAEEMFGYAKKSTCKSTFKYFNLQKITMLVTEHILILFMQVSLQQDKWEETRLYLELIKTWHNFPVEVGLNPFKIQRKKTYVMAIIIDITERKKQKIKLLN